MLKQNILHSLGESRVKNETKDKGTPDGKTLKPKTACRKTESQSEHPFKMINYFSVPGRLLGFHCIISFRNRTRQHRARQQGKYSDNLKNYFSRR
jgi:hypothetical protein